MLTLGGYASPKKTGFSGQTSEVTPKNANNYVVESSQILLKSSRVLEV